MSKQERYKTKNITCKNTKHINQTPKPKNMQYRRARARGGTYFFTLVTYNREKLFNIEGNITLLRAAFQQVMDSRPFTIDAHVIMPEHFHFIWTLPEDDRDFSMRWKLIKSHFTRNYADHRKQTVWQRRFWEHCIRNEKDMQNHVEYIHYNPVHHGLVKSPLEWKLSSLHRYVDNGLYPPDWGAGKKIVFDDTVGRE